MEVTLSGLPLPLRFRPPAELSDEEIMRLCAQNHPYRVERDEKGEYIIMSPTGEGGSEKNVEIVFELELWNRQAGHGRVTESNGGYVLPDTSMRAPDAAFTSKERMAEVASQNFSRIPPDFIIELRSPSDALPMLQRKMESWVGNGVQLGWLIDPYERTVTIYRPNRDPERLDNISQIAGEGPVAGFVLPLDRIF